MPLNIYQSSPPPSNGVLKSSPKNSGAFRGSLLPSKMPSVLSSIDVVSGETYGFLDFLLINNIICSMSPMEIIKKRCGTQYHLIMPVLDCKNIANIMKSY